MIMERFFLLFLLEVTAKATTVVGVAGLACWMLGRASAAVRHFIWVVAIVGVLVLPLLTMVMPKWRVSVPALQGRATVAEPIANAEPIAQIVVTPAPSIEQPAPRMRWPRVAGDEPIIRGSISNSPNTSRDPAETSPDRQLSLPFLLLALWGTGAILGLGRCFAGHLRLWWIKRHTDPITDPTWIDLSRRVAHQLRLSTVVRLLRCRRPIMPVCWGVRRPSLLLPSNADTWTVERRQIVLLHELAHAKRRDCLTQAMAQLAIAVHWFNPLVWMAVRRLRAERERACDDLVLAAGASAPDYADHLLDIARAFRSVGCPSWAAVAMARPSQLEGRLLAILDRHRDRRALTRRACAAAAAFALAMVGTLAAVQPAPAPAAADAQSSQAVSKSRRHPTLADASGTATEARSPQEAQPMPRPVPDPRPIIVPKIDLDSLELDALEFELQDLIDGIGHGVGKGIGEGIGVAGGVKGGVLGGVKGGIGKVKLLDAEALAQEALRDVDTEEIAREATESALAQLAGVKTDTRPEADPRIVAALTTALKDQNADVRRQAAMTLSQMRSPQAVDALIAATTDADQEVRRFAVHAISRHKSEAVTKALVRALKDSDGEVRQAAMHGVARLRDPQYIDVFAEALKDSSAEVRQEAAHALAQLRDARAVLPLMTALKDADADVRQQAAHALGEIGDARAVDTLVTAMKDANVGVRQQVVHALGRIGQRSAREKGHE